MSKKKSVYAFIKNPDAENKPASVVRKPSAASAAVIPTEHQEQVVFVQWMRLKHPAHRIFAIPSGGFRHITTAVKLKKEGVSAGVPDMQIISLGLFIELKRKKGGVVSKEQRDWIEYIRGCGYIAEVCNGFDEAKQLVEKVIKDKKM